MFKRISQFLLTVFIISFFLTGCTISEQSKNETEVFGDKASEAVQHVIDLSIKSRGIVQLDLSDDMQYKFVLECISDDENLSRSAGEYSEIRKNVEELRQRQLNEKSRAIIKEIDSNDPNFGSGGFPADVPGPEIKKDVDHFAEAVVVNISEDEANPEYRMMVSATATISETSPYTYVSIQAYDDKTDRRVSKRGYAQYPKTTLPRGEGALISGNRVTCNVRQFLPNNGEPTVVRCVSYQQIKKPNGEVISVAITKKCLISKPVDGYGPDEFIEIDKPRDKNEDGEIRVCIDRKLFDCPPHPKKPCFKDNGRPVCDYLPTWTSELGKAVQIPFKGLFRIPKAGLHKFTLDSIDFDQTFIKIVGEQAGGSISLSSDGISTSTFAESIELSETWDGWEFKWDIPREDSNFCDEEVLRETDRKYMGKRLDWFVNIAVYFPEDAVGDPTTYAATSAASENTDADLTTILRDDLPPLFFWWSCIAEGSMVLMADDQVKAIEDILIGEQVKSSAGMNYTVAGIAIGKEHKPMVKITDEDHHTLLLSQNHPVITRNRGLVSAIDLKVGDIVNTITGPRPLISVLKKDFGKNVYNLFLGSDEEIPLMEPNSNVFYAGGIVVGDGNMQAGCVACFQKGTAQPGE